MLHHVQLACPPGSETALRGFYGGVLGLTEIPKPPVLAARGGCWFRGHGIELHLGVEADFRPARKAHPGLLVRDLDEWARRLTEAGYPVAFDDDFPGCAASTAKTRTATAWSSSNRASDGGQPPRPPKRPRRQRHPMTLHLQGPVARRDHDL